MAEPTKNKETKEPARGLAAKLAEIMGEIGGIPKDKENKQQGYRYRSEDAVMERVRGLFAARSIAIIPKITEVSWLKPIPISNGREMNHCMVGLTIVFVDGESGETIEATMYGTGADSGDKAIYKAITGATKYIFNKTLCISDGDDAEADPKTDEAHGHPASPAKQPSSGFVTKEQADQLVALFSKMSPGRREQVRSQMPNVNAVTFENTPASWYENLAAQFSKLASAS